MLTSDTSKFSGRTRVTRVWTISSFDTTDISVSGVTIDSVEHRGRGLVRYHYAADGDKLSDGPVSVTIAAAAVSDRAGNANEAREQSFSYDGQRPAGMLDSPVPGSAINVDAGFVDVTWTDAGPSGIDATTLDVNDVRVAGVTIDRLQDLGNGQIRYWYNDDGNTLPDGTIEVVLVDGEVMDVAGNRSSAATFGFTLDRLGPIGELASPGANQFTNVDAGYVDVDWTDRGLAGVDATSIDVGDITVSGVTIDRVEMLTDGDVRYWYNDNGDALAQGEVVVTFPEGAVVDLAGNLSEATTDSFGFDSLAPSGVLISPVPGSTINEDAGYIEIDWDDLGNSGLSWNLFDTFDVTITGVTVDRYELLEGEIVRYWYGDDGDKLPFGIIEVTSAADSIGDFAGNGNAAFTQSFTLESLKVIGELVTPAPLGITSQDRGYLEVQWTGQGLRGIDANTFGVEDVTVTGVDVDHVEDLGGGLARYWYNDDGDVLTQGLIDVMIVPGSVADITGNLNVEAQQSFTLDSLGATGELVQPVPTGLTNADLGYMDVQWTDRGAAGIDATSFGIDDVTITGVDVDRAEDLGGGLVRYWYNDDGDSLPQGVVEVSMVAGSVADLVGNLSAESQQSFTLDSLGATGELIHPVPLDLTTADKGYVEVQWTDRGVAGIDVTTYGSDDVTVSGVDVDRVENLGGGMVRYWYNDEGDILAEGAVTVTAVAGAVSDNASNPSDAFSFDFTFVSSSDEPVDISSNVTVHLYGVEYNWFTGVYGFYASITNNSNAPLAYPLRLVLADLVPGTLVLNPLGTFRDGTPYHELSGSGELMPGETSGPIVLTVKPPGQTLDTFTPRVFAVVMPSTGDEASTVFPTFDQLLAMAPSAFRNARDRFDVNDDGKVSALDALTVINHMAADRPLIPHDIADAIAMEASPWVDVNGDKAATALDALQVINEMSRRREATTNPSEQWALNPTDESDAVFADLDDEDTWEWLDSELDSPTFGVK